MMTHPRAPRLSTWLCGLAAVSLSTLLAPVPKAQTAFEIVHAFDRGTDGARPQTALLQATDGNFYGTTSFGGVYGNGAIYRLTPEGTETVLHSFDVNVDGTSPSTLIEGADGQFYGTARRTGFSSPWGFVFRMAPDGTFTTLHAFTCGADGAYPAAALVQADDGNFYGTTRGGANEYCSTPATVFRLTPEGTLATIHVFTGGTDGTTPTAALIQARDGDLYGTTSAGGPLGGGTVFRMTTDGTLTVVHAFRFRNGEEGFSPEEALLETADGTFYGTTRYGGRCTVALCGTLFRLRPDGTFQTIYAFEDGAEPGRWPSAPLMQGRNGHLYGTTQLPLGAVFEITPDGDLTVLHAFTGAWDGRHPAGGLLQAADGAFYGTANAGGPAGTGTVFRLTADGTFEVIYTFPGSEEGASPTVLIQGADGSLYGTTETGGTFNGGTVFRLAPDGTTTGLHSFQELTDGMEPSTVLEAADGTFYGLTTRSGPAGGGTFFRLTPDGDFTVLQAFTADPASSALPSTGLLQASDGSIYGAASRGGAFGRGAVFRWSTDGTFTFLHSFSGGTEGTQPLTLLQAADGNFYGTTWQGGALNRGTAFRMTLDGTVTTLGDIDSRALGHSLIQATDGNFYLTSGPDVVRLMADGTLTVMHTFVSYYPQGLMQASDGHVYGTAAGGSYGILFRMTLDGTVTVLHTFSYPDPYNPRAAPIQADDGRVYGTTLYGGPGRAGVVFRVTLDTRPQTRRFEAANLAPIPRSPARRDGALVTATWRRCSTPDARVVLAACAARTASVHLTEYLVKAPPA